MIKLYLISIVCFSFFNQLWSNSQWVKNTENIYTLIQTSFNNDDAILVLDDNDIGRHIAYKLKDYSLKNIVSVSQISDLDILDKQSIDVLFKQFKFKIMFIPLMIKKDFGKEMLHLAESLSIDLVKYVNLIEAAHNHNVRLFLLSPIHIYSQEASSPISEKEWCQDINLQFIEETIKVPLFGAIKLCQAYKYQYNDDFTVYVYPELYGMVEDSYLMSESIISNVIKEFLSFNKSIKNICIWGDPENIIQYLHLDDLVDSLVFGMKIQTNDLPFIVNIAAAPGHKMAEVVQLISQNLDFKGEVKFDVLKNIYSYQNAYFNLFSINNKGWSYSTHIRNGLKKILSLLKNKINF